MEQLKHQDASSEELVGDHLEPDPGRSHSLLSAAVTWIRQMTIFKALVIVYCLNIVAWGGMIFLLMCNAAPAMCHPTCDDINSPRRKWIEIDSQILNALFCIPAFWLAPRRCIEAWKALQYMTGQMTGLRQLAATYREWFRLPGSEALPAHVGPIQVEAWLQQASFSEDIVPYPTRSVPEPPPSGRRATPTRVWKLQAVVALNLLNTMFQVILSLFMWLYNRHNRPGWSVGLFLCLAFVSSIAAGVVQFLERKKVQRVEGRPSSKILRVEDEELKLLGRQKLQNSS
ncbi:Ff.00g055520.m01.CDS01 [Fusarium sp. VM40]|nr:Ff.00g055520.m01.CDS01 [Fusarium sp. VM40]